MNLSLPFPATVAQRWRDRRDSYRPAGETIATARYEVAELASDSEARAFVVQHHYAASYPAARFRFGLWSGGELVGVAVCSHPCRDEVITRALPVSRATDGVELGRFVLLDSVPANGETWFLGRCWELLRGRVAGVVSFSDPVARRRLDGSVVHPGHVGTIYQAHNGIYLGRSTARTLALLPDGTVFSARAAAKIRSRERGWRYAAELLVAHGAAPLGESDDARAWLATWAPRLTRQLRHPGNHRYVWGLDRAMRRSLSARGPYPKRDS